MIGSGALVPVFVQTARGKVQDGMGYPVGTELVVHIAEWSLGTRTWYRITHVATGTRVATFRSHRSACRAAQKMAPYFEAMTQCDDVVTLVTHLKAQAVPAVLKSCQGFVY